MTLKITVLADCWLWYPDNSPGFGPCSSVHTTSWRQASFSTAFGKTSNLRSVDSSWNQSDLSLLSFDMKWRLCDAGWQIDGPPRATRCTLAHNLLWMKIALTGVPSGSTSTTDVWLRRIRSRYLSVFSVFLQHGSTCRKLLVLVAEWIAQERFLLHVDRVRPYPR